MTLPHIEPLDLRRGKQRAQHALALLLLLGSAACSGTDDRARVTGSSGQRTTLAAQAFPCDEGEVRECSVFIKERSGIVTCAVGIEICESGRFSECEVEGPGSPEGSPGAPFEG
jgi:hypothetical protein